MLKVKIRDETRLRLRNEKRIKEHVMYVAV